MELVEFRSRYPARDVTADGLTWQAVEAPAASEGVPCLLMLPGTLGTAEIWWNQIAALAGSVRMLAVTYPVIDDAERLVDGLVALCRQRGIARTSVIGSSLGGFLSQLFAARHSDLTETLFIGNSLSDPDIANVTGMDIATLEALPAEEHRKFILASVDSWPEATPAVSAMKQVLYDSGRRLLTAEALKARVLTLRKARAIPKLAIPDSRVVVIDAEDDPLIPRAVQDDVVRRYPGGEHQRLPFGGHYPYVVDPEPYTAILRRRLLG
ncbi:alpha/beta fold hydrolase [Ferrovibrio sp.]|uniref:alpha/beta fold hydrolase n=1 Tax=Ferrovibrio sp. TaxID=1917215 RepID=UPI003517A3CE